MRLSTRFSSLLVATALLLVADSVTYQPPDSTDLGYTESGWVATDPPPSASYTYTGSGYVEHSQRTSDVSFLQSVSLVRFSVDLPSGATVDSAYLELSRSSYANTDGYSLGVDSYSGSNWPIDTGDYTTSVSGSAGAVGASTWAGSNSVFDVSVNVSTIVANGWTGYRLGFTGGPAHPTGSNYFGFSGAGWPHLIIYYTLPSSSGGTSSRVFIAIAGGKQ